MGATVTGISLYHYEQASDTKAISELVRRITDGEIDAITFTNGPQARFLLNEAMSLGNGEQLLKCLKTKIVVASIGEVTSRALQEMGIEPHVTPDDPKMGPMVKALGDFFEAGKPDVLSRLHRSQKPAGACRRRRYCRRTQGRDSAGNRSSGHSSESEITDGSGLLAIESDHCSAAWFIPSDVDGVLLVISATDDPTAQSEIAAIAASRNILVNTVDKPELCTFIVPAILRRAISQSLYPPPERVLRSRPNYERGWIAY
jgi:hypothetical protein